MDRPKREAFVQTAVTEAKWQSICQQLERLFASPSFNRSIRYRDFLRFVVEETLLGRAVGIKDPEYLKALVRKLPEDWQEMNLESVIGAQLVRGKPVSAVVEASYLWR